MAGSVREDNGAGRSSEGISIGQLCQSGNSLSEWHSSVQVENGTHSTPPPYWDTDSDDDCGAKPSELYGKFTWKIENFSQINKRELRSNAFEVGSYKWYILIYPQGCDVCNHLSLFLCVANHDKLLRGWSHFAQFTIAVVNKDPKKSRYSDTLHRFWKKEHDWGWKKFMELTKVSDGFIVSDTLVIKAQVQVIREKAHRPFRCLDCQYRRELVRVYLSNVELICRRFVEEKRGVLGNLIEDKVRWSSFRAFWLGVDRNVRQQMSRDKTDAILKDVVKSFFIEKEVTSTLVMHSLYSGLRALEAQNKNKKGMVKSVEMEEIPAPIVFVEKDMFVLADDVLLLLQRAANEPLPPKDDKGPQNRMKDGSSGDDFSKDSIERDERRLTELGRRTLEIFVLAQIFRNLMDSHNNSMAADSRTQLLPESHNNYSSAGWDVKHLSWGVSSAPTGHSDVVDSQEVDEKGQQSSDEEEFDDAPDDDEYDTEDSFIDDAELEPVSPQQPGQRQFQQSFGQLHLMTQQPQSRIPQLQQEENQVNLIEKMNIQGPVTTMQSTAVSSSQQGSISLSAHVEVENGQQKMVTGFQPSSDLESASGHTLSSLPQDMVGSLPRNTIDAPHLTDNSTWSHNVIQLQHGANSLELNSIILQEQHLKQQKQEQQLKNEYEHHQLVPLHEKERSGTSSI